MQRRSASVCASLFVLAFAASAVLTGCNNLTLGDPSSFTAISASVSTLRVNQQIQISSHSQFNGIPLEFFVNGVRGGNEEVGTIDATGLYTAPAIVPLPNTVKITSVAAEYPNFPPGSVALGVLNPIPVLNTITPSGFSEGTEIVTVSGSQFVYGAQILWNGAAVPTTYVAGNQLVAQVAAPKPGTFPLMVSNPNPGSANSKTVSVVVGPGQVVLTPQPEEGTDVRVSSSIVIGLQVNGTLNTGVTLQVNGIAGGNAQVGTAVSNSDGSITYSAPAVLPTPSNVVQLKITSVDNPKVWITQDISVLNPIPILSAASPMAFNTGPATIVLTGRDFISGAQVLVNGFAQAATFNNGGQLTATVDLTEPGKLDLQVLNPSPGPAASQDLIAQVNGTPPVPVVSPEDASRFLQQATFGATDADIHHLSLIGYPAWLNEQFAAQQTLHAPAVEQAILLNPPVCDPTMTNCNVAPFLENNNDEIYFQDSFWQQALAGNDQLRQRVKYTLSEMLVISDTNPGVESMPRGEANYYDTLGKDGFGNFRQLLEDVTLSPMMGQFLSMLGNDKGNATTDPDENYAREVMQLFTIGLWQLNDDGSQKLDGSGNPIPTYSNLDVMGLAKVFTGFSWNVPGNTSDTAWSSCCIYAGAGHGEDLLTMASYPSHHSTDEKDFLGVTIPAPGSAGAGGDLKIALDTLFNHPNLPPFFCKQMIQHLVTSNPSPTYIGNCSAAFKDNGSGVRGDMKAVISEILLDPEARNSATDFANPQYGKVRESLLRYTEWARAFTAQSRTGSYYTGSTEDPIWGLGEMTLRSPTVFNWFAPGYVPPGTSISQAGLLAPEMQMTDVTTVVGYLNYMQYTISSTANQGPDVFSSYSEELRLAATPDSLVDRVNLLLMAGEMDGTLRGQILGAVNSIEIPSSGQSAINAALLNRVETAIYLTMAAPSYSAQF